MLLLYSVKCQERKKTSFLSLPSETLTSEMLNLLQKLELVEGKIYSVSGLVPMNTTSDFIYLKARGSTTEWKHIPSNEMFE